jgi:regulator of ribonuclease activity A
MNLCLFEFELAGSARACEKSSMRARCRPDRLFAGNGFARNTLEKTTCDLCDEYPSLVHVAEPLFHSYGGRSRFSGCISTIRCREDNSRFRELIVQDGAGRVIVIDGGGSLRRALVGDQLAAIALSNGWQGIVVHGAVRDAEALADLPLGVFALGLCPMRPANDGVGEQGIIVRFAGISFEPGHYLYADRNGIVVAPHALS